MPKLGENLDNHTLPTGSYGYSAIGIEDLGATEYTIVTIVQDVSGSVCGFVQEMEKCIGEIIKACRKSPRSDNLLVRLVTFNNYISEVHGYKLLSDCNPDDYKGILNPSGGTYLFDAAENAIAASADYGKTLMDSEFEVNSIVVIITDGCDYGSKSTPTSVNVALKKAMHTECLESIVTILVGVGVGDYPEIQPKLDEFKNDAGLTQFVAMKDATGKALAKLAQFVSQSISAQSQALGQGGPSQPLVSGPFLKF